MAIRDRLGLLCGRDERASVRPRVVRASVVRLLAVERRGQDVLGAATKVRVQKLRAVYNGQVGEPDVRSGRLG